METSTKAACRRSLSRIASQGSARGSPIDAVAQASRVAIVNRAMESGMMIDKIAVCERIYFFDGSGGLSDKRKPLRAR
ncbi:hypothetical protein [Caballeronia ptereochthonis]|uniref:hypothetical protein n=1 Tax=Caballeronia ptereochthonis TaxID=1777144 RepID=UPI000B1547BC|nr:hypothetical protein [Caballeronia ptereochthonis]